MPPTDQDLLALMARGELAAAMSHRFNLQADDEIRATEAACARLHNSGAWDLLGLVERGELQGLDGFRFFLASNVFERILPELEADAERVMACVESLVARGGDDLASNQPNAALRAWCARDPARSRQIMDAARAGDPLATRNLTFALEAMGSAEEARGFLASTDLGLQLSAITALGRIPDPDQASRKATVAAFARLAPTADDGARASLLRALGFILSQVGATARQDELALVRRLTEAPGDHTIHATAQVIWLHEAVRTPELLVPLLTALAQVKPENKGTLNELDQALRSLLESGQDAAALDFVTELFSGRGALELTQFGDYLHVLCEGPPEPLARAVVRWLLDGSPRLCEAISTTLRRGRDDDPMLVLDEPLRGLSAKQHLFICRKAIAWFFIKPRTAASVLVSILRVCDATAAKEVENHLVEPLLVNYGGLREVLEALEPSDPAKPRVKAALKRNDAYLNGLRDAAELKEFYPSEAHRQAQRLRVAEQSREIARQAREHSVLLSLVKRSTLLYGRGALSFVEEPDGELRPIETDLHEHGVSFELPRMEIVDPIGLDYTLRVYRAERMPQ